MAFLLSLLPMFGWGINNVLVGRLGRRVGFLKTAVSVQLLAWVVFLGWWLVRGDAFGEIKWSTFMLLGLLAAGNYGLMLKALASGQAGVVTAIVAASSLVTATLGIAFLGESVSSFKVISVGVIFLGLVGVSFDWKLIGKRSSFKWANGVPAAILASLGFGFYFFFLGPVNRLHGWFMTTLILRGLTGLNLLILWWFMVGSREVKRPIPWRTLLPIILIELVGFTGYNFAVTKYEVSYVYTIANASPIVSLTVARIFFKEKVAWYKLISVAVIIGGIVGMQWG